MVCQPGPGVLLSPSLRDYLKTGYPATPAEAGVQNP